MIKTLRSKSKALHQNEINAFRRQSILLTVIVCALLFAALPVGVMAQEQQKRESERERQKADERWSGVFTFEDTAPPPARKRRQIDVAPFVSYEISVEREADGVLKATFSVNGMQQFEAYRGAVEASDERLDFYYERFAADGAPDTRKFKRGELLFSLIAVKTGRMTSYLYEPAAYKIMRLAPSRQKQPVYFVKQ